MRKYLIFITLSLLLFASACDTLPIRPDDEDGSNLTNYSINIYVSGNVEVGADYKACYWLNGSRTDLESSGTGESWSSSIFVSGSDVYVSGSYQDGFDDVICYWKNGTLVHLSQVWMGGTTSIFVTNNDVYVSGYSTATASYWKNGILNRQEGTNSTAQSLYLDGSDVYVAGSIMSTNFYIVACYWLNNNLTELITNDSKAYSIYVNNSDVYVAGYYKDGTNQIACYWLNGAKYDLLGGRSAEEIYHDGTDLYIGGTTYSGGTSLCYWKNDIKTDLTSSDAINDVSMIVLNGQVYMSASIGTSEDSAYIWGNGTYSILTNSSSNIQATSVFAVSTPIAN